MRNSIFQWLPVILIAGFILYYFINQDKNLSKAISEIETAKNEVKLSLAKIDAANKDLLLIHSEILTFNSKSDSLYNLFDKTAAEFIRKYNQSLKPEMDKLRSSLDERNRREKAAWKPIQIVN